ncbi:hypothetical protein HYS28_02885 [Candidatus Uhrbacteria bacterium]|nr:hypothetical protein [Candidatus Uhrbacteria bacterium]
MRHEPSIHKITDLARWGMLGAYMLLMYASGGDKKELRRLHDEVIPTNCRLLREDYLEFEGRVGELINIFAQTTALLGRSAVSDAIFVTHFRLVRVNPGRAPEVLTHGPFATLHGYYADVLNRGRERSARKEFTTAGAKMILGSAARFGYGSFHFQVCLQDLDQSFACSVHRDATGFFVTLMMGEHELTEPITYYLRSRLPSSTMRQVNASSSYGSEMTFLFELPDAALASSCREDDPAQRMYLLASDDFEASLIDALRAVGVPIKNVTRLPAPEATQ